MTTHQHGNQSFQIPNHEVLGAACGDFRPTFPCVQEENLTVAKQNLESNKKDLELMKDYATTAEVCLLFVRGVG